MQGYLDRNIDAIVLKALGRAPVVAVLGPRQCGKTTLCRDLLGDKSIIYVDLQINSGRAMLAEPELFFKEYRNKLICLDEIQTMENLFSEIRGEVDKDRRPGRFLILGSASRDLIRQASESLAGRIEFINLTPFVFNEISSAFTEEGHWLKGGFPNSLLADNQMDSYVWRENYIKTYLERDIPQLGFLIPVPLMEKLWVMLAHYHGHNINYHKLSSALDITFATLKKYIYILEQTYMIRLLYPFEANLKKRLVKAPKVFIRDTGMLHTLLKIKSYEDLLQSPNLGASYEGYIIENVTAVFSDWSAFCLQTAAGAEIDLYLTNGKRSIAIEIKRSASPKLSRGYHTLCEDLNISERYLIAPVELNFKLNGNVTVLNLGDFLALALG